MAYNKTTWTDGSGEPLSATNLNNIENGISDVDNRLTTAEDILQSNSNTISSISTSLTEAEDNITTLQSEVAELQTPKVEAYCCYTNEPSLSLAPTFQRLETYTPLITPLNISLSSGVFTAFESGVYRWDFERGYENTNVAPSSPIEIAIEIRKNTSTVVYTRTAIIGAATAADEPSTINFTSPFVFSVNAGDTFEFYFKATDTAVTLSRVQLAAHKII